MDCTNISDKKCTGCGLCKNVCPYDAINMIENKEGFLFPKIDKSKCQSCGLCYNICDEVVLKKRGENKPLEVKACQTKNEKWLIESTAGGFFPTLAQWVIEQGGVVFGTAYDEHMRAVICKADNVDDILKFNGSKYVQSDLSKAYLDVKNELLKKRIVLFSGTPCQNVAINAFCNGINTDRLITLDIVCYGVPSSGLFRSYLDTVEFTERKKVVNFRFRDKHKYGWSHTTVITLEDDNGTKSKIIEEDHSKIPYYKMFGSRDCFRKSCYCCSYNTIERVTDFTTGNFWGIDKMTSDFDTFNGVSMVLINSMKAQKIFGEIENCFIVKNMSIQDAIRANDALIHTCKYPRKRDKIYKDWHKNGFLEMYKKRYTEKLSSKIIFNLKKYIKILIGRK